MKSLTEGETGYWRRDADVGRTAGQRHALRLGAQPGSEPWAKMRGSPTVSLFLFVSGLSLPAPLASCALFFFVMAFGMALECEQVAVFFHLEAATAQTH